MGTKTVKITKKTAEKLVEIDAKIKKAREKTDALYAAKLKLVNKIATRFNADCKETEEVIIPWESDKEKPYRRIKITDKRGTKVYKPVAISDDDFIEVNISARKTGPKKAK